MNLPLNIARRYLFSKKMSLVNVISLISIIGVAGMTAALIVILSVFNGFDSLIQSMMNQFDPDVKINIASGKTFHASNDCIRGIKKIPGVKAVSCNVEETALFKYDYYQHIATLKGVDDAYAGVCGIPECVYVGDYMLADSMGNSYAVVGADVASQLWIQVNGVRSICIYAPLRREKVSMNPSDAFARGIVMPSGVFHIHQDYDAKYVIVPLDFARRLLEYDDDEVSSIEVALHSDADVDLVLRTISDIMGDGFVVKDRYQQQDMMYKIMKSEKLSIFVMLSFIIVIASFNIIGALTMLIIDKKRDIQILRHLGANNSFVKKVFRSTGNLITVVGAASGMVFGLLVCWAQETFHFLTFPDGAFIIDSYPVEVRSMDVVYTLLIVLVIGFVASVIPTRKIAEQ